MDKQQLAVKLIMDKLNNKFSMRTFSDRLVFQKTIYLVQELGIDLGYHFSWYLKGPYSSRLATDGFLISHEVGSGYDESKSWKLDDNVKTSLNKIRPIFDSKAKDISNRLELLASVHFLKKRKGLPEVKKITDTLQRCGKAFSEQEVEDALRELKLYGLID